MTKIKNILKLTSTILFFLGVSLGMNAFETSLDSKQTEKLKLLQKFCQNKTENFCSQLNLGYMYKVILIEQAKDTEEKNQSNKKLIEVKEQEIRQNKIVKFMKWHPRYKMLMDFFPNRFFK